MNNVGAGSAGGGLAVVGVLWDYFQSYHWARLRGLMRAGEERGVAVVGLEGGAGGTRRDSHDVRGVVAGGGSSVVLGGPDEHLDSPAVAAALVAWMEANRPGALLIPGYGTRAARAALRVCRRLGTVAVVMFETQERDLPRVWWREWFKRWLLRRADAVLCGGISHAAYARRLGVPAGRIFDGYDVVDNGFWAAAADEGRAEAGGDRVVLGVGRFVTKKNFPGLVREFATFAATPAGRGFRLRLIGEGPERPAIEAQASAAGISAMLELPGYRTAREIAREMGRVTVFVMPSSHEEQWGLVVNEAMAAGVPAIVSEVCGCVPDLIEAGKTGLLFDPRRPGALAAALAELAGDPDRRAAMAARARERIARFSPEYFAAQAFRAIDAGRLRRS